MIDPRGMTAIEWTDRMALLLPGVSPLKLDPGQDWKTWARHVIQYPSISQYNPPNPDRFDDWVEWASRFNQSVPVN